MQQQHSLQSVVNCLVRVMWKTQASNDEWMKADQVAWKWRWMCQMVQMNQCVVAESPP